jgi:hypothetical protein
MTGAFLLGAISAGWTAFLISQGLDRADQWSSVAALAFTVFFGIAGLIIAATAGRAAAQARTASPSPDRPAAGPSTVVQHIEARGNAPIQGSGVQYNSFHTTGDEAAGRSNPERTDEVD